MPIDRARIQHAVREILLAIGEDPEREGLKETPARVADSYEELFSGISIDPRSVITTTHEIDHGDLILVRNIDLYSICEHHLIPFHGVAHIGYAPRPDGHITGLSKLARLVDVLSHRPQVQERLTSKIADVLVEALDARGVIVVAECEHLCMSMRGVRRPQARTVTSALRGTFAESPESRAEVLHLLGLR